MNFKPLLRRTKGNGIRLLRSITLVGMLFTLSLVISNWHRLSEEIGIAITFSSLALASLQPRTPHKPSSPVFESNATHLWSIRLADKDYFRLARRLPCRTVVYVGGPSNDAVNSCDYSPTSEFSVETTLQTQKWLFDHQHPHDCSNKRFAIINNYALSGLGSTLHQIVSALSKALSDGRIAVYASPGNWLYGDCSLGNPDCFFLPITNCSVPTIIDGKTTIELEGTFGQWNRSIRPAVFQNRTFNWFRSQLLFYLTRYNARTLEFVQKTIAQNFLPPSLNLHRPFIAIYVRRSDKVKSKEMSQAYTLKQYFDLFAADARTANITTVYLNSEDAQVFDEYARLNVTREQYRTLLSIQTSRNVVFRTLIAMSRRKRGTIVLEFLTDLFIEAHADLHAGTLTSNWCRLVDEIRLTIGKTLPFYTPENTHFIEAK